MEVTETSCVDKTAQIEQLNGLIDQGRFRTALYQGEEFWGAYATWSDTQSVLLLSRILGHLGLERQVDYINLKLWRKNCKNTEFLRNVAFYWLEKYGPSLALDFLRNNVAATAGKPSLQADWLLIKSLICTRFRDWEEADRYFQEGSQNCDSRNWVCRVQGYILAEKEEHAQAKDLLLTYYQQSPNSSVLCQLINVIHTVEGQAQAISFACEEAPKYESVRPWLQLARYYSSEHSWQLCAQALDKAEEIAVGWDRCYKDEIDAMRGRIALERGDSDKAMQLLGKSSALFYQTICENYRNRPKNPLRKRLPVPYVKQKYMTCAPASISALLGYHGISYDQDSIARDICYDGTPDYLQHKWLQDHDIPFREFSLTWQVAKTLIDRDLPFTMVTHSGFESHIQVVTGYDENTGVLLLMDPSSSLAVEILAREAIEVHAYVGPRCMVFLPGELSKKINDLALPSERAYALYAELQRALREHSLKQAREYQLLLQHECPEDRLTLMAARALALYEQNEADILIATQDLHKRFPKESFLTSSAYYSLYHLGKRQAGLELVREEVEKHNATELTQLLFREIYEDADNQGECNRLLRKLRMSAWSSAETHWLHANWLWRQGARQQSIEKYRWALTLEDTNEKYAESYFRASLAEGDQLEALQFLRNRWEKFASKSSGPVLSLCCALELLDREHEAPDYLEKNLDLRPDDGELAASLLRRLIASGRDRDFEQRFRQFNHLLSEIDRLHIEACSLIQKNKIEEAIQIYQRLLTINPLNLDVNNALFQQQNNVGLGHEIDARLKYLLDEYGEIWPVCWLHVDWHNDAVIRKQMLQSLVFLFPDSFAARSKLASKFIEDGELQDARVLVERSIKDFPNRSEFYCLRAQIFECQGDWSSARQASRHAVQLDVNSDEAVSSLMSCHVSPHQKLEALCFLRDEIDKGVQNDGLWNYWHAGQAWLSADHFDRFCEENLAKYPELWASWALRAKQYQVQQRLENAEDILKTGIDKFPLVPRFHFEAGALYALMERWDDAIGCMQHALQLSPGWTMAARRLSGLYERLGDLNKAMEVLRRCCRHNTDDGVLWGMLADLQWREGESKNAIDSLKIAVEKEPDYPWAWQSLDAWLKEKGSELTAIEYAEQLLNKYPNRDELYLAVARLCEDAAAKEKILKRGIGQSRTSLVLHRELTELFIEQNRYSDAQSQVDHVVWGGAPPVSIKVLSMDILAHQNRYGEAVRALHELVTEFPQFAAGWDRLRQWNVNLGNYSKALQAAEKSVQLQPHDARTLTYAFETANQTRDKNAQEKAEQWIERAFSAAPDDQYVGLTRLDDLLDKKRYEEAVVAESTIARFNNDEYLWARIIQRLCAQNQHADALEYWSKVLNSGSENTWVYYTSLKAMDYWETAEKASKLIDKQIEEDRANPVVLQIWAEFKLKAQNGTKLILQRLNEPLAVDAWMALCRAYFEYLEHRQKLPSHAFVEKHRDNIYNDTTLYGTYGFLLLQKGRFKDAISWYQQLNNFDEVPGYVYYHYHRALVGINDWKMAGQAIRKAASCVPDHCYSDIQLWLAYDKLRYGPQALTEEDFININEEELTEVEQYVFSLLMAWLALGDSDFCGRKSPSAPWLRQAQSRFQTIYSDPMAKAVKSHVASKFVDRIPTGNLWTRLKLRVSVSNHF